MRRTIVAAAIAIGLLPAGHAGAQPVRVPILPAVDLAPARFGTAEHFTRNSLSIWCPIQRGGTMVLDNLETRTGGAEVAVGVGRSHDPGTAPLPCPETWTRTFTGRVRFDLPAATNRRLLSARLQFTEVDRVDEVRTAGRCNSVVGAIGPMVGPWMPGLTPGHPRDGVAAATVFPQPRGSVGVRTIDVTDIVQRWFEGSMPNHGLALIGVQDQVRDRNMACAAFLRRIHLIIRWQSCPAGSRIGGRRCFSFSGS
jgi:hypothetical protein